MAKGSHSIESFKSWIKRAYVHIFTPSILVDPIIDNRISIEDIRMDNPC